MFRSRANRARTNQPLWRKLCHVTDWIFESTYWRLENIYIFFFRFSARQHVITWVKAADYRADRENPQRQISARVSSTGNPSQSAPLIIVPSSHDQHTTLLSKLITWDAIRRVVCATATYREYDTASVTRNEIAEHRETGDGNIVGFNRATRN